MESFEDVIDAVEKISKHVGLKTKDHRENHINPFAQHLEPSRGR